MFISSFEKTAGESVPKDAFERAREREDQAWSAVNRLLSALPKADELKVGDVVFYNGETGWKYGEDARHTKGEWDGADWNKDAISNGEQGVVVGIEGKEARVRWDKHHYKQPANNWSGRYRKYELRKDTRTPEPGDFMSMHIARMIAEAKKVEDNVS